MGLIFEWDPAKAHRNMRKHGVAFERALLVFADALSITVPDERRLGRWLTMGEVDGKLLVVVHEDVESTSHEKDVVIRLISARRATKPEAKDYRG